MNTNRNSDKPARQQGHWLLAKMGKKVLRPGGRELTEKMIDALAINQDDDVVEFAPGLGITADIALIKNPHSYTGIELDDTACKALQARLQKGNTRRFINANANNTTLEDNGYSKVYGEAMLTMQADKQKRQIISEAHRILKSGGLYGIHELSLTPNDIDPNTKDEIQKALAKVIKVNARPLTVSEWSSILEQEGFEVIATDTNAMHLLEKKRVLADEGLLGTAKIAFNMLTHPAERKRILAMRKVFRQYQSHLGAVAIVARKI